MADWPGSHRADIIVDLGAHSFQNTVRAAVNHQAEAVIADLEAAYHSRGLHNPQVRGVQVSVNINYSIRSLDSEADLSEAVARQDRTRVNSDNAGTDEQIDQLDTEDLPDEEARPTLLSSAGRLLESLPVINLDDLQDDSRSCPVCQEAFPGEDLSEVDTPVMLHCNHIIGRACIERWILGDHNSCPLCRAAIFEPHLLPAPTMEEELEPRLLEFPPIDPHQEERSQENSAEWVLNAREHSMQILRRQVYGPHAATGDNEAALAEPDILPAQANEEAGESGLLVTREVESEFLAFEREDVEQRARFTQLRASPFSEERAVAMYTLTEDLVDFTTRLTTLEMGIHIRRYGNIL